MRTKYQCEYCFEYFTNESEAKKHENSCPSKQTYKFVKRVKLLDQALMELPCFIANYTQLRQSAEKLKEELK